MRSVAEKLPELRIAIAQAERERVSERTKRALERLREKGKVYTKPTFIYWLALHRSGKRELKELSKEEIEEAKRYFFNQYARPYLDGVLIRRLIRSFSSRKD